jgi:hypothetical protein
LSQRSASYQTLQLIYMALGGGVLLFAVIVFLVIGPLEGETDLQVLRWVWLGLALTAIFAAGLIRGRLTRDATAAQAQTVAVTTWGLAEGQALLGLVAYLVAGDSLPAILGLVVAVYLFARHRPATFEAWFRNGAQTPGA